MNKKIEDYLHYYIGQDIQIPPKEDGAKFDIMRLTHEKFQYDLSMVKLLLRPLSDMTDADIIELFKTVSLFDLSECSFDVVNTPNERWANAELDGRVVDSIKIIGDNVEMMNNDGSFSAINPVSSVTHYLLKQGFDLFGLIEANLAVDKTKEAK